MKDDAAEVERVRLEGVETARLAEVSRLAEVARLAKVAIDAEAKRVSDAAAAKGGSGVAIGLGVGGAVLAVAAVLYCVHKKKAEKEAEEGGERYTKESLIVHFEEA